MKEKAHKPRHYLIIWIAVCILAIFLVVYVFFYAVHPILTTFVFHPKADTSLSLYTDGEYLTFEDGESFSEFLSTVWNEKYGKEIDFYHFDTKIQDNPIYGKNPDFFSLDVQYNEMQYEIAKAELLATWNYGEVKDTHSFALYMCNDISKVYSIGFNDTEYIIRFMMATEMDGCDHFLNLIYRSGLEF